MGAFIAGSSTMFTGLFVGAMLLIAVALVPYWRGLAPAEFRAWFVAHSRYLGRVMVPLGMLATGSALVVLAFAAVQGRPLGPALVHAAGLVGVLAVYYGGNKPINDRLFALPPPPEDSLAGLRRRWAVWHWIRVGLGLVALGAAV